jgi:hypothetical protein
LKPQNLVMIDELSRLHMDQRQGIVIREHTLSTYIIEGIDAVFNIFPCAGMRKVSPPRIGCGRSSWYFPLLGKNSIFAFIILHLSDLQI